MVQLIIYKSKIRHNLEKINKLSKNNIYVLKDNAYGLGIKYIAKILNEFSYNYYAVSNIDEALKIQKVVKDAKILILSMVEPNRLKNISKNIELSIINKHILRQYQKKLGDNLENIPVHIKVNTGLNRLGFSLLELDMLKKYNLNIVAIYSHLADVENEIRTKEQINIFNRTIDILKPKKAHLLASPGLFKFKNKYLYDYCRVGMSIYGLNENVGLLDVFDLVTKVIDIREVKKGDFLLYSSDYIVPTDMKIAIIPVGYSYGKIFYDYVIINNKKARIISKPCMDMTAVDITGIDVNILDKVYIIGQGITVNMVAKKYEVVPDEIITSISSTIKRKIKD